MIRTKKAGLLTKLVVLVLLVYLATSLLDLQGRIKAAQTERDALITEITAQERRNAALTETVENADDPDRLADIAREKLGLVQPGEKIFQFTN